MAPRPLVSSASMTVPKISPAGLARMSRSSATNRMASIRSSRPVFSMAEIGTKIVSPSQSSGTMSISASCCLTRSGAALSLSILFKATIMATWAARV